MKDEHDFFCDRTHTPRQACNRSRGPDGVEPTARPETDAPETNVVEAPFARVLDAPASAVREAPHPSTVAAMAPVVDEDGTAVTVEEEASAAGADGGAQAAIIIGGEGMPTPSPWAVRAWEDTAAAVGATATAAAPVRPTETHDDQASSTGMRVFARQAPLIVGLAGAATLAIVIARRRRR